MTESASGFLGLGILSFDRNNTVFKQPQTATAGSQLGNPLEAARQGNLAPLAIAAGIGTAFTIVWLVGSPVLVVATGLVGTGLVLMARGMI